MVLRALAQEREDLKEAWANGEFARDREQELGVLGKVMAYKEVIELEYDDLKLEQS